MNRILVVDDEADLAESVQVILSLEGYAADIALDGKQALEMLSRNAYGLLITDVMMPRMGGLELIDHLTRDERYRALPIVVASARKVEPEELARECVVIRKPYDPDELVKFIRELTPET